MPRGGKREGAGKPKGVTTRMVAVKLAFEWHDRLTALQEAGYTQSQVMRIGIEAVEKIRALRETE